MSGRPMTLRQRAMFKILVVGMMAGKGFFDADFGNRKGAVEKMGKPSGNAGHKWERGVEECTE